MLERVRRDKVLIVLHQDHSTPGRVGTLLAQRGFALDVRRPSLGEPLPATLAEHAGAIVFGGPMSANDDHLDWVRREIDWLAVPLSEDKPLLGVCLGAQMLARHLGVRVFTYPDKRSEIGYYPITPTPDAARLCAAPFPRHVYHWHCDGFELPRGARLLAASDGEFPNQAFAFGSRALALQFHPEVTYAMICRWTTRGDERLERPGAQPRSAHLDGWFLYDRAVALWLETMLSAWLDGALAGDEARAPTPLERAPRGWRSAPTLEVGTGLAAASPR
ncbi:MAG: glutamine amidotransferase [Roseiarcus sp.]